MKLVTFNTEIRSLLGAVVDDVIMDIQAAHTIARYERKEGDDLLPNDIIDFLLLGDEAIEVTNRVVEWYREQGKPLVSHHTQVGYKMDEVSIVAPVPFPTSMRDAYAFRQHVEAARRNRGVEMIKEFDDFPVFYFTNHNAVTGPGEVLIRENHLEKLDFELEAAIVIGKEGRDIKASEADEYIFGYTIMNDWSARALQMQEMKLNLGPAKGKDFATSIGPWLVTKDELADKRIAGDSGERFDLGMKAFVNGKEVSSGNMKDMTWTFAQILERASYGVTLYPGEVIGSGTVGTGCFLELNGSKVFDPPWWLKDGDTVELEIERLGKLTNTLQLVR